MKLVRDKIPEIIERSGRKPVFHVADREEYWDALLDKLRETTNEFIDSESAEKLGDVLEVVYAICDFRNMVRSQIEDIRAKKAEERGAFKEKIILEAEDQ